MLYDRDEFSEKERPFLFRPDDQHVDVRTVGA